VPEHWTYRLQQQRHSQLKLYSRHRAFVNELVHSPELQSHESDVQGQGLLVFETVLPFKVYDMMMMMMTRWDFWKSWVWRSTTRTRWEFCKSRGWRPSTRTRWDFWKSRVWRSTTRTRWEFCKSRVWRASANCPNRCVALLLLESLTVSEPIQWQPQRRPQTWQWRPQQWRKTWT